MLEFGHKSAALTLSHLIYVKIAIPGGDDQLVRAFDGRETHRRDGIAWRLLDGIEICTRVVSTQSERIDIAVTYWRT